MEPLYQPEDEVEALALEAALDEAGVRFVMRPSRGGGSLGLADPAGVWGTILVHPEDLEEAQHLVADWLESEVVDESHLGPYRAPAAEPRKGAAKKEAPSRSGLLPWALLVLALVGNLLQWVSYRDLGPATVVLDAEGRRLASYRYEGDAELPTQSTTYDKTGAVAGRCFDQNVDGWFERCDTVLRGGRGTLRDMDEDGDGWFELSVLEDEGGREQMRWVDANGDGMWERIERPDGGFAEDTDGDGIVDRWTCESGQQVDVNRCVAIAP